MSGDSWKITLPCTRVEAMRIAAGTPDFLGLEMPPVFIASEPDSKRPEAWRLDAYLDWEPDADIIARIRALVPSAGRVKAVVEHLVSQDWVTLSQQNLHPIRAGRFYVYTQAHADTLPDDRIGLRIEAGRAFGTGQHETTTGCLIALDRLARLQRFRNVLDMGTGTGILALAAIKLWRSRVIASDIDPVSIEVTRENILENGERLGHGRGRIDTAMANGLAHPRLQGRAPYDLIVANILAGPLITLAPAVVDAMKPGGTLVLAGLLQHQAVGVIAAYRRRGLRCVARHDVGDWPTLVLRKRLVRGARRGRDARSRALR